MSENVSANTGVNKIEILSAKAEYNPSTSILKTAVRVKYSVQTDKAKSVPKLGDDGKETGEMRSIHERVAVTSTFTSEGLLVDFVKRAMTAQPLLIKVQGANRGLSAEKIKKALDGATLADVPRTRTAVRTPADILKGVLADAEMSAEMDAAERKALEKLLARLDRA